MDEAPESSETPARHNYPKGIARRAAIIEVATDLFGRAGYRGATMLQIAAACGISRAGLLHHFPTKESLLAAVLSERDRIDRDRLVRDPIAAHDGLAALADLISLVQRNSTIPAIVNLFAVLSAEAGDPSHPAHAYFVDRYETARSELQQTLMGIRDRGLLAPGVDPGSLAIELIALMDGLQVQWLLAPERVDMASHVRRRIESALIVPLMGGN
jgi:AcrR family transcriptional regulator